MAIPVLVMGRSGSGKTYSLKSFEQNEVGIVSVEKGRLPFKSKLKVVRIPA
jgi:RNase adaptor protein for sRNA GlmZ degradation